LTGAESAEERLARRLPLYRSAHLTVDTGGVPPGVVVDRILAWFSTPATEIQPSGQQQAAQ
jgi:hypothetical protein